MKLAVATAFVCVLTGVRAGSPLEEAKALYLANRYPEAEAALREVVKQQPQDAAARFYLGMTVGHRSDDEALNEAAAILEKAAAMDPKNAEYEYCYAKACFHIADRKHSLVFALRGRDATKHAIAIDPGFLNAREALMEFYARAPWPLGGPKKALEQADEIARIDRVRGVQDDLFLSEIFEKNNAKSDARSACQAAIRLAPADPTAAARLARLATP
jgi:cytochrome c-type biogenesis protein CcmH/NrfG